MRPLLSPRWGLLIFHSYPRLAPWALFLRRFAAEFVLNLLHRTHWNSVLMRTLAFLYAGPFSVPAAASGSIA